MLLCSSRKSTPLGPRTSTPAGSGISQDLSFEAQFSPSIPPTPSPTPRTGRQPASLLNLAREQVRAQGINPMEFMVRPLCEAGRRGGVGPIVVPPFTPPTPQPSSLDFSSPRSTPRRRKRGGGRRRHTPSPAGPPGPRAGGGRRAAGGGGGSSSSGGTDSSINTSSYRRSQRRQVLSRELQRLQQDNIEESRGRQIAGVTHTNTITTTYKDGGTPTVSRSSSRVSN